MRAYLKVFVTLAVISFWSENVCAQNVEPIKHGNMDSWITRVIKESSLLGGKTKHIYEIGPTGTITGNKPYLRNPASPWATSNVMAKVMGIIKTSNSVFPEKRGDGYCVRMETILETCKVIGIVNITVVASGSIYLGEVDEPVRDTKNPQSKLMMGIPFTKKPKALQFDYKVQPGGQMVKATGFGSPQNVNGSDKAEVCIMLQKRWEDADGNIYAKRIGTGYEKFDRSTGWVNNHRIPIHYGNITRMPGFKDYMNLISDEDPRYCRNSKGKVTAIKEVGWGNENEEATHIIVRFSASDRGAFIGSPGSKFWVDNVEYIY